jgi:peptide/nickel transport system permease protein
MKTPGFNGTTMIRAIRTAVLILLVTLGFVAAAAPFLSPHSPREQFREYPYAPPQRLRFSDLEGRWHWPPFVYQWVRGSPLSYVPGPRRLPVRFFVPSEDYQWMGMTFRTRLLGSADREFPLFLLGTDGLGRDLLSRLIHGAQFSLAVGAVALLGTCVLGILLGSFSGYAGGAADAVIMRLADLFLSVPSLFLILGLRAVFPLQLSSGGAFWLIVAVLGLSGWALVGRVIRGQVLTLKNRDWVLAARVYGASHWRILALHILPFTFGYLMVQVAVLLPAYILGEVTLSFLGMGVQEPDVSWGLLLSEAVSISALTRFPWLLSPAVLIFLTVLGCNLLVPELQVNRRTPFGR